ncbi:hypothetical protein [Mesoflavibacter sp. CH_XMU1422-2]|uniref:hypothetical protein n=1 Tax=Mesoflavibacter sp. CH_XMU1422-2 TaxID=3107770 RepID=UPI003008D6F1
MKTKKNLATFLLIVITHTLVAQEKQNDATWAETVGFINKNLEFINGGNPEYKFTNFNINSTSFSWKWFYKNYNGSPNIYSSSLPLSKLLSVEIHNYDPKMSIQQYSLHIKLTGSYILTTGEDGTSNNNYAYIYVSDIEMRPRIYKAFQHLAYLATEKRKQERETSGDKF